MFDSWTDAKMVGFGAGSTWNRIEGDAIYASDEDVLVMALREDQKNERMAQATEGTRPPEDAGFDPTDVPGDIIEANEFYHVALKKIRDTYRGGQRALREYIKTAQRADAITAQREKLSSEYHKLSDVEQEMGKKEYNAKQGVLFDEQKALLKKKRSLWLKKDKFFGPVMEEAKKIFEKAKQEGQNAGVLDWLWNIRKLEKQDLSFTTGFGSEKADEERVHGTDWDDLFNTYKEEMKDQYTDQGPGTFLSLGATPNPTTKTPEGQIMSREDFNQFYPTEVERRSAVKRDKQRRRIWRRYFAEIKKGTDASKRLAIYRTKIGAMVKHPDFGVGKVLELKDGTFFDNGQSHKFVKATVKFRNGSTRILNAAILRPAHN